MDIRKVKKLIELLEQSDVAEIEIHEGEESVRISRNGTTGTPVFMSPPGYAAVPAAVVAAVAPEPAAAPAAEEAPEGNLVRSPMIGTFYRAPSPESAPYVEVGTEVGPETVVCIIEAMKVMNEIKAEVKGVITQVMLENAKPVEFNQPLFKVRPS